MSIIQSITSKVKIEDESLFYKIIFDYLFLKDELVYILKSSCEDDIESFLCDRSEKSKLWWKGQFDHVDFEDMDYINEKAKVIAEVIENFNQIKIDIIENKDKIDKECLNRRLLIKNELFITDLTNKVIEEGYYLSDEYLDITAPDQVKSYSDNHDLIDLPEYQSLELNKSNILDCIAARESRRNFKFEKISLEELSYLLWITQGVKSEVGNITFKTIPASGGISPFETYIFANNVEGLKRGIYRYIGKHHKLLFEFTEEDIATKLTNIAYGQSFVGNCAVCFMWSAIPYRQEWRYQESTFKNVLIEAGHLCQNLYLGVESLNLGTCSINSYNQLEIDKFLKLDGTNEFIVYLAPVGKY